jgi:phytoene synthase
MESFFDYCENYVKREDPDRYSIAMFASHKKRQAIFALFAFNAEVSKTREVVSETTTGLMRLLWWRESIQAIYECKHERDHPVLNALQESIQIYDLPQKLFEELTYGREFDLEDVMPGNIEGLKNYCDFTHTPLIKLCQIVIGDTSLDPKNMAIRYSMAGLLRSIVPHAQQARCYMPEDLIRKQGLNKDKFLSLRSADEIQSIAKEVYKAVPSLKDKPETDFFRVYNHLTILYLKKLEALDYNVLDYRLTLPILFRGLRLWKATIF